MRDREFFHGVALVIAELARHSGGDEPTKAANLLAGFGLDVEDFRRAKVDGYDMRVISKLYRDEPSLKQPKMHTRAAG